MRGYCFLEHYNSRITKVECSVDGRTISKSEAQKIVLRAAAGVVMEKLRKLGRLSEKKQD